jgi:hypothetical protein
MGEDKKIYFSLHTKPATSKILHGLHVDPAKFIEGGNGDDLQINPQYSEFLRMY